MNFLARSLASRNPSATSMISQISSKSGTTIAQGLKTSSNSCQGHLPRPYPPTAPRLCPQVSSITHSHLLQLHLLGSPAQTPSPSGAHAPRDRGTPALVQTRVEFLQGQGSRSIPVPPLPVLHHLFVLLSTGFLVEGGNPPEHPLPLQSSPAHPTWPPLGSDRTVPWCQGLPHTRATSAHQRPWLRSQWRWHMGASTEVSAAMTPTHLNRAFRFSGSSVRPA